MWKFLWSMLKSRLGTKIVFHRFRKSWLWELSCESVKLFNILTSPQNCCKDCAVVARLLDLGAEIGNQQTIFGTKIDIFKVSLTTGPKMKEIKRMEADFYQFNSHDRESVQYSTNFSFSTRPLFALFVQSLFHFAWSSGQLTESSDKLMQQWEYNLWTKWNDFIEPSGLVFHQ